MQRHEAGCLPHAILISGIEGTGKRQLATALAEALLCASKTGKREEMLNLLKAGSHPDLTRLTPLEGKATISVEQIREVSQKLSLTPQIAARKIAVIELAEQMTVAAANALLKTLEEPPGDTLILLISHNPGRLPQTIRSRCQSVSIPAPDAEAARMWLAQHSPHKPDALTLFISNHSPGLALQFLEEGRLDDFTRLQTDLGALIGGSKDVIAVAASWKEYDLATLYKWLLKVAHAFTVSRLSASESPVTMASLLKNLKIPPDAIDLKKVLDLYDDMSLGYRELDANLNRELVLEQMFLRWSQSGQAR